MNYDYDMSTTPSNRAQQNIILNYILLPVTDVSLNKLIDLAALCSNNGHNNVVLEEFIDGFAFALMRC